MAATIPAAKPAMAGAASQDMPSDALVFFGATGDMAYKKIFPALQHMIRRGTLEAPIIGVAKSGWTIEQLRERARDSLKQHGGGVDEAAFTTLVQWLRYVDGDYQDPGTFDRLRHALVQLIRNNYSILGRQSGCRGHDLGNGFGGPVKGMRMVIPFFNELV
jgi:glucose-6-phosphate 1-dehydrogenase